jgi:bifunctional DNA-binding transcriptional regulator/antitoxin component of YhaV-PrlF toxin-antitoxin module
MPTKYKVTLTSLGSSSVIVLPKPVVDGFNLEKGNRLEMIVKDDGIYIPLTPQDSVGTQQEFTPNEAGNDIDDLPSG